MKVELPVQYMQDTWALNADGEIDREEGETMDISNNGSGGIHEPLVHCRRNLYLLHCRRIGTASDGKPAREVVGVICWMRESRKADHSVM